MNGIFAVTSEDSNLISYNCNGQEIGNNIWAFFHKPCIVVSDFPKDTNAIYLDYNVDAEDARKLMEAVLWEERLFDEIERDKSIIDENRDTIKKLKEEKEEIQRELVDKQQEASVLERELNGIINSKSWKLISLFRKG